MPSWSGLSKRASVASERSMAIRWPITSTASTAPLWVFAHRAIWLRLFPMRVTSRVRSRSTFSVRHGPGVHPAERPAHQIRQRQACGARLGVPLGSLRVAGADLHPNGASGAHGAPFPSRGSEGARPPASPSGGHAECGHGG